MPDPIRATTGDPRFDPNEPVLVNGYRYVSAAEHDRRVTELLGANNRYLERARSAERQVIAMRPAQKFYDRFLSEAYENPGVSRAAQPANTGGSHAIDPTQNAGSAPGGATLDPEHLPRAVSGDQEQ